MLRIGSAAGAEAFFLQIDDFTRLAAFLRQEASTEASPPLGADVIFGGGAFGGAGASRDLEDSTVPPPEMVILLIEETTEV